MRKERAMRDAIERAIERLDNLIAAMRLPIPDSIHVTALRGSLPDIRRELAESIGYDEEVDE